MFRKELRCKRPMVVVLFLLLLVVFSPCAGCGKKGALIPPDGYLPPPVSSLQVVQQGERFRISWMASEQDFPGAGSSPLAGFRLYRREIRSPADECLTCGVEDLLLRSVELEYLQDVVRDGNLFAVVDGTVQLGKSYQYQVTAFEKGGVENRDSGRVKRKKVQPPPAPIVGIGAVPAGLLLEWPAVEVTAGTLTGYNIYRSRLADHWDFRPLTSAPVRENRYEDLRMKPEILYRYQVRSVANLGGETVESDPSPQVEGSYLLP